MILRVADRGEVLGVPGTIVGRPHAVTAETLEPTQVGFIPSDLFLRLLAERGEIAVRVAQLLSKLCFNIWQEACFLGLSRSSSQKTANFLLDWSNRPGVTHHGGHITLPLTHAEIAQMIHCSRETVTRRFAELRRNQIIRMKGPNLIVLNRKALESLAR